MRHQGEAATGVAAGGVGGGDGVQRRLGGRQEVVAVAGARRGQRAAYSLTEAGIQVLPVMVALGNWGLAHRDGEPRLRVRAELLRDGGAGLVAAMMDELRELHLGVPRPAADAPRPSELLRAAYEAAVRDGTGGVPAGARP